MEQRFRHDFSKVRVHTDARAVEAATAVRARAYTVGRDIVFGAGQYAPGSREGRRLLAHELTHTAQQSAAAVNSTPVTSFEIGRQGDDFERQADAAADHVLGGTEAPPTLTPRRSGGPALQGAWLEPAHVSDLGSAETPSKQSGTAGAATSQATFTFQTFIPDKYVPGTRGLGYGDSRGFGNPGDSYRTFQHIVVETDEQLNASGEVAPAEAKTGYSETMVTAMSGHASSAPLHMVAKRLDATTVTVVFFASIRSGAKLAELLDAIDFTGWINIRYAGGKPQYLMQVSHDAFPAYEAFLNDRPIYRWCYPATHTVANLKGQGTEIQAGRRTGDAPGGVIGPRMVAADPRDVFKGGRFPKGEAYIIKPGDNLSKIALENLGDALRWREIYDENREVIGDESHALRAGATLIVHRPADIHNLPEAMFHALDPRGGLMRIKGPALDYVKRHETTKGFRSDFETHLHGIVTARIYGGSPSGSFAGVYNKTQVSSYGGDEELGDVRNWPTLGTFLLGHCYPQVRYTVRWTSVPGDGWTAEWSAVWFINDDLDLVGGPDKSPLYNKVSKAATATWHDALGGRKNAPLQASWPDSGTLAGALTPFQIQPAQRDDTAVAPPSVLTTGDFLKATTPSEASSETKPGGALGTTQIHEAVSFYEKRPLQYPVSVIDRIRTRLGLTAKGVVDEAFVQAVALYQRDAGLVDDGKAGIVTLTHMFGKDIRAGTLPVNSRVRF